MKARIRAASKAALIHLAVSAFLLGGIASIIFFIWFQSPYYDLFDGVHLALIAIIVDVVCGPLTTAIIFNPAKPRRELILDLSLVAMLQLAALGYGIYVAAQSRPVALVFEVDRFVAVAAGQVNGNELQLAPEEARSLPLLGEPRLLGTRDPQDGQDMLKSVLRSMAGEEPSVRPSWWQSYSLSIPTVKQRMKKLADLSQQLSAQEEGVLKQAVAARMPGDTPEYYLPLTSQKKMNHWVVLLNADAMPVGFAAVPGWSE